MSIAINPKTAAAEVAIISRVLLGTEEMSPAAARYFIGLDLMAADKARMADLLKRNQDGDLSPEEIDELHAYARAGSIVSIFHLEARKVLKKLPPKRIRTKA